MNRSDKAPYILLVIFALLVLAGFYFLFIQISNLRVEVSQLAYRIDTAPLPIAATTTEAQANNETLPPPLIAETKPETGISIPTGIIFKELSSALLQPQTEITVTVESLTLDTDGTLTVSVKAFTNDATSYSAIEMSRLFEVISLTGDNVRPLFVNGTFNSIPPKSASSGSVVFKLGAGASTVILQIGSIGNAKFYEFDFKKKTYKETTLG